MRKVTTSNQLMTITPEAKKFWGKEIEDKLPKPKLHKDISLNVPSLFVTDIMQYARSAESRGEWLIRKNYLHPLFDHFEKTNTTETTWKEDPMGNMYVQVGEVNGVLHVGHIDTVHDDSNSPLQEIDISEKGIVTLRPSVKQSITVNKVSARWVKGVDVKHHYLDYELPPKLHRCLGADDACALATMLFLISNQVVGTYVFTRGEEIGCVGTHYIIDNDLIKWEDYMVAIEVDRKGTTEIIGNMSVGNTASQSFVSSLADQLGMGHKMGRGTITDVGHMADKIPECVNISAGYNLQHSERETTDLVYLDKLGAALLKVKWDELVIERRAGQYKPPVVKSTLGTAGMGVGGNRKNNYTYNSNYQVTPRNTYGDFAPEPDTLTKPFSTLLAGMSEYQQEAYVRQNNGLLLEFLLATDISPSDMHNFICFGDLAEEDTVETDTALGSDDLSLDEFIDTLNEE